MCKGARTDQSITSEDSLQRSATGRSGRVGKSVQDGGRRFAFKDQDAYDAYRNSIGGLIVQPYYW